MEEEKIVGTVKFFEGAWGFIIPDSGEGEEPEDVFVHLNSINTSGVSLKRGQRVSFNILETAKGVQAKNVELLD